MDANKCELCCTQLQNFGVTMGSNVLLHNVNLHIHCGELTVLIGPNGAGKTTLLRAILGEIPHTGTLSYLDAKNERTGRPIIGYVPQKIDIDRGLPASVLDFCTACISQQPIWLMRSRSNQERIQANLAQVQAEHLIHQKIGTLSGGELQRVLLASALDPIPDLLLLDEPVSAVDPIGMEMFYELVSSLREKYDLSIIMVSHDLALAPRAANRLVLLNKTVLAAGTPSEVLHNRVFSQTYGQILDKYAPIDDIAPNLHH